jgi:hypothetical protein
MEEVWKDIVGYEGIYQISNLGRVKSLERISPQGHKLVETIRNTYDNGCGYLYIDLYDNNAKRNKFSIHRIVATAFIDNPNGLPCVNHKDENKKNNCADNLEWCTHKYNNNYGNHGIKASLAHKGKNMGADHIGSRKVICITTGKVFDCISEAAKFYNIIGRSHISGCCRGEHKYIGKLEDGTELKWMYYDDYLKTL